MMRNATLAAIVLGLMGFAAPARARTLLVGPTRALRLPSAAVAQAADGDTILIDPGTYYDCIAPTANHLTIAGVAPVDPAPGAAPGGAVLTDSTCQGKAVVVARGADMALRDLTLQRARVPDGNGAGIRAEGRNLSVDRVRFINDQAGIVAADVPGSTLLVAHSLFRDDGACAGRRCVDVLDVGAIARLRISDSTIIDTRAGHDIVSAAGMTEIVHDRLIDGPTGAASFQLVLPAGGGLLVDDSLLEKGPKAGNTRAAILLDGPIAGTPLFRRDRFENHTGAAMPFILNWSSATPTLRDVSLGSGDRAVSSRGAWLHAMQQDYLALRAAARHRAGVALRAGIGLARRLRSGL